MIFSRSHHSQILYLVTSFTAGLLFAACSATLASDSEIAIPTFTPRPTVPTATPTDVGSPTPTAEEVVVVASPLPATATPTRRPPRTVNPEELTGYIPNPYMGWQDTQRRDKRFFETVGYRRVNWNQVNPAEGVYDWTPIESLRADMAGVGGTISFRIRTAQPPPWGNGHTLPDWLISQGLVITEAKSDILKDALSTEPLYSSCLFLEAHGEFIEAMRRRYDGDPDVAFIDIGSYGGYGEWWSDQYNEEQDSLDWHARRRIIDMYVGGQASRPCLDTDGQVKQSTYNYQGFQETQLIIPYTPWFADSVVYAVNRRTDVGIRHDALGSESHQKKYREEIGQLVQQRWLKAPIIFEYYPEAYTPEALRSATDFAREMHASFIHENFDGRGSNELIRELLEIIGYRLVLVELTYTPEVGPGETFAYDMTWENQGIAPSYYVSYPLVVSLNDKEDNLLLEQQLDPDIRNWLPGKPIRLTGGIQIPADFEAGTYYLKVAFVDPASGQSALNLAIAGHDWQGRYLIGSVTVLP